MSKTITPNRLEQATKELANLNLINFTMQTEIGEHEKDLYYVVAVKSSDSRDGMQKIHNAKIIVYNRNSWDRMKKLVKQGIFNSMCCGQFNKVVILHDPLLKEPKKNKGGRPKKEVI